MSDNNFGFKATESFANTADLADKQSVFDVESVAYDEHGGFRGRARWVLTISIRGHRTTEKLTLSCNEKRDEEMKALQQHLQGGGTCQNVYLRKSGNAFYLANA